MKKYELTSNFKMFSGKKIFQIRALVDLKNGVKAGELGGWIEKEENLSHKGNAWVYDNAQVFGNAQVYGNAQVCDNAQVSGNAWVHGNAQVSGDAWVYGNAQVSGNAWVHGNAWVYGDAWVYDNAQVFGNAWVHGNAWVYDNAQVSGNAWVHGDAWVYGNAQVFGNAWVYDDAEIYSSSHVLVIGAVGSRIDFTTFYRDKDNEITVKCGCFLGKLDDFLEKVTQTHGNSKYALVYRAAAEVAKLQIDLSDEAPKDTDEA